MGPVVVPKPTKMKAEEMRQAEEKRIAKRKAEEKRIAKRQAEEKRNAKAAEKRQSLPRQPKVFRSLKIYPMMLQSAGGVFGLDWRDHQTPQRARLVSATRRLIERLTRAEAGMAASCPSRQS